jgi:hypothetical protein
MLTTSLAAAAMEQMHAANEQAKAAEHQKKAQDMEVSYSQCKTAMSTY